MIIGIENWISSVQVAKRVAASFAARGCVYHPTIASGQLNDGVIYIIYSLWLTALGSQTW